MAKTRGSGLSMAWTDVDPAHEATFNVWYNEEHMPRLAGIPGFLSGARSAALRGGPKYLAMYELEDHNVLRSAAFLDDDRYLTVYEFEKADAREGNPWNKRMRPHVQLDEGSPALFERIFPSL